MGPSNVKVFWAWIHGSCLGAIVYAWSLTGGTWNLLSYRGLNIHDVQATALANGHLAAPKGALSIEGFVVGGHEYSYFGPFPALIRLPLLWLWPQLDGRLSILSLLAAYVVVAFGSAWFVRELCPTLAIRHRSGWLAVAALGFAATGGSVLTAAAAAPNHYHESLIWGLGLSFAALAATMRFLRNLTPAALAVATVLCTAAANARSTTGLAVSVGLIVAVIWSWLRGRLSLGRARAGTGVAFTAIALIPAATITALNYAKFKMLIGLPMANQVYTGINEHRRQMLDANGGSYFRLGFVPTNLLQYSRPDFAGFSTRFPFLRLPQRDATRIGHLMYDQVDHTTSVWGASLALAIWAVVAMVLVLALPALRAALLRWRDVSPTKERIALSLLVGFGSIVPVATIGFIGNRYLIDFMPLLVTLGMLGYALWERSTTRRWVGVSITVLAAGLGGAFNASVAFAQHGTALDPAVVRNQVRWSLAAAHLGIGAAPKIEVWNPLIPAGAEGDLMIVEECEALYRSDGSPTTIVNPTNWRPVERSTQFGAFTFRVNARAHSTLDRLLAGSGDSHGAHVDPVHGLKLMETVEDGSGNASGAEHSTAVFVNRVGEDDGDSGQLRFSVVSDDAVLTTGEATFDSLPFTLEIVADRVLGLISVRVNDKPVVSVDSPIQKIVLRPDSSGWLTDDDLVRAPLALCASARSLRDGT